MHSTEPIKSEDFLMINMPGRNQLILLFGHYQSILFISLFFISYSGGPFSYDLFFVTLRAEGSYQFYVHSFSVIRRVNLKTGVSRKQSSPNILKNKHFLSVYVRIRGYNKRYNPYIFCWWMISDCRWHFCSLKNELSEEWTFTCLCYDIYT